MMKLRTLFKTGELETAFTEVFTLSPYSMWNPRGIHVIPDGFHPFHMEYVLAGIPAILVIPFHEFPPGIYME